MNLKNLMVDTKSAWVPYGGFEGFEVEVANISRERLTALRKSCVELVNQRRGVGGPIEQLNETKFVRAFTDNAVKGWRGLKLSYVEQLMLVDIQAEDPDAELPYDQENAELLVKNSADFDTWLNEVVFDLDNFRSKRD